MDYMFEPKMTQVPHLTTALTGPLQHLEKVLLNNQTKIEAWFRQQWHHIPPPLTTSVDLRNSGFKLAPVDTNLFPAGFNNLNPEFFPLCVQSIQASLGHYYPQATRVLLIPENHTRNQFYFENLYTLYNLFVMAGFDIRIGSLLPDLNTPTHIKLNSGQKITLFPIVRHHTHLSCEGFLPDIILLNNDLSEEIPELLANITQPIIPEPELGWSKRLKSNHFKHYHAVCNEFAELVDIDPWLINPIFSTCSNVDFLHRIGEECLYEQTSILLTNIQKKYDEYQIAQKPFIIIKADAGTYGMGVLSIHDPAELKTLNRKQRVKMTATKGGKKISNVILQEGVYSFETWGQDRAVAEPVIYMLGEHVVGGFYRIHKQRSASESLNAPGMYFEPLAFATSCNQPGHDLSTGDYPNRFYAYGVIARLALIAATREQLAFSCLQTPSETIGR